MSGSTVAQPNPHRAAACDDVPGAALFSSTLTPFDGVDDDDDDGYPAWRSAPTAGSYSPGPLIVRDLNVAFAADLSALTVVDAFGLFRFLSRLGAGGAHA